MTRTRPFVGAAGRRRGRRSRSSRDARLLGLLGEARDHVVGLVALDPHVLVAERLDQRLEVRPLLAQQVGPRLALGLVGLVLPARGPTCPASQTTIVAFGPYSVRIFTSMLANPKIAFVGSPARGRDRCRAARRTPGRRGCCRRSGRARRSAIAANHRNRSGTACARAGNPRGNVELSKV